MSRPLTCLVEAKAEVAIDARDHGVSRVVGTRWCLELRALGYGSGAVLDEATRTTHTIEIEVDADTAAALRVGELCTVEVKPK